MKKLLISSILSLLSVYCYAQPNVSIIRNELGSGTPPGSEIGNLEKASQWSNDIFHAPQYMPGYPTAAIIYPRVIDRSCFLAGNNNIICDGYNWLPELGRGEYLMFRPVIKQPAPPKVVTETIIKEVPGPVREIYVEVPVKKKGE